jgi:predicted PurR-regulated permease PerM
MNKPRSVERSLALAAPLIAGAVILLLLYFGRPVLIPLAMALLIAFMLQPAIRRLRRIGLGKGTATAVTATAALLLLGGLSWFIAVQVNALTAEIPKYKHNLISKITELRQSMRGGSLDQLKSTITEVMDEVKEKEKLTEAEKDSAGAKVSEPPAMEATKSRDGKPVQEVIVHEKEPEIPGEITGASAMLEPLATAGLVLLLVILFLLKWGDLRQRLIALVGRNLTTTTTALDDAGTRVSKYLSVQFLINLCTGVFVWTGLSIIGIPYAGLMGLCAGLFRYVPYAGPMAAAALPIVMSFITSSSWQPVIAVGIMFLFMELVLNNIIEPWLYGTSVGVSEIGIIIATVVWTFLWGPAGLVLATPLTVCLVVLGKHVSSLSFLAKLLSDNVDYPIHETFTQRLMAGDTMEATDILNGYRESNGAEETFDNLIVPALARVRNEQRHGHLEVTAASRISSAIPQIFEETGSMAAPEPTMEKNSGFAVWSLCPMSEAAASLLEARLQDVPCEIEQFNAQSLASDISAWINSHAPIGVLLLSMDDSDFQRLSYALRRLRRSHPNLNILPGRWGGQPFTEEETGELLRLGAKTTVTDPAQLRAWLMPLAVQVARIIPAPPAPPEPEPKPELPPVPVLVGQI